MRMKPWNKRSIIEAALFNPAFCGELLLKTISAYNTASNQGRFPYVLSYLVLPFLLNDSLSSELPKRTSTSFVSWVMSHEHLLINFDDRVKNMNNYTTESLLVCFSSGLLAIGNNGDIEVGESNLNKLKNNSRDEVDPILKRAEFLGTWFSKAGDAPTIYSLLGITV